MRPSQLFVYSTTENCFVPFESSISQVLILKTSKIFLKLKTVQVLTRDTKLDCVKVSKNVGNFKSYEKNIQSDNYF